MKTIVVTGAARGLGFEISRRSIEDGFNVVMIDRDVEAVEEAAGKLGASFAALDVSDRDEAHRVVERIATEHGPLYGLVNNAGFNKPGPSATLPAEDWSAVLNVNLSGTFYMCQASFPHLCDVASIVNLGSILGLRGSKGRAAYTATKAGIVGLTKVLAVEWATRGVRVNAVAPSWTQTPSLDRMVANGALTEESLAQRIPMQRVAKPEDISGAVSFLMSNDSVFVSGQTLYVDGGYTASA